MDLLDALGHALSIAAAMGWEILWALVLGFLLSAIVESVVKKGTIGRLMGTDRPKSLAIATGLGASSSSCSYAAVALARSLFRKGANFTAAMAFEIASTNLVIELGVLLALLLGWQFTLAEFIGGPVMIIFLAILFRLFLRTRILEAARAQADLGLSGKMEGHAAMDMSVQGEGSLWHRMLSPAGRTSISEYFVMNWASVWVDIVGGLAIAGAAAAWIPDSFWQSLFLVDHPLLAKLWGPIIGPLVAVISFVCSIGNVPLAAVLWNGGISFGGVISFIFADLIVIPVLIIYRKYYGTKMMLFIFVTFYVTMVAAGYVIEILFGLTGLTPTERDAQVIEAHFSWNYTTYLNIAFLVLAAALVTRFVRSGGVPMLKMMKESPGGAGGSSHHHDG
ncbi:MAG: permease [Acidimicrobiia bacterium]